MPRAASGRLLVVERCFLSLQKRQGGATAAGAGRPVDPRRRANGADRDRDPHREPFGGRRPRQGSRDRRRSRRCAHRSGAPRSRHRGHNRERAVGSPPTSRPFMRCVSCSPPRRAATGPHGTARQRCLFGRVRVLGTRRCSRNARWTSSTMQAPSYSSARGAPCRGSTTTGSSSWNRP